MSKILRAMSDGTSYNIIVKLHLSYDGGGVPVGGHAKVASQTEDRIAHATYIYTMYTYINISSFLILSMYVRCSSLFLSSLMAFVCTFRVCHARDLACELVNGGGPPVGLYGKVASNSEDCGLCFLYIPPW